MKKLLLIFTLLFSTLMFSTPSYGEWTKVISNKSGDTYYVDFERIRKHGGYVYFWLISNPQESYPIPIILYWIPDVIGWNGFFIVLGVLAGLITLGICGSIAGEEWAKED